VVSKWPAKSRLRPGLATPLEVITMKWLKQLFSRGRRYNDLSESIREHFVEKIEDLMEDGMSRDEATRTARREFGNVTLIQERSREVWQWPTLESIWADGRYALRQLSVRSNVSSQRKYWGTSLTQRNPMSSCVKRAGIRENS
jgi:hypothetical protein